MRKESAKLVSDGDLALSQCQSSGRLACGAWQAQQQSERFHLNRVRVGGRASLFLHRKWQGGGSVREVGSWRRHCSACTNVAAHAVRRMPQAALQPTAVHANSGSPREVVEGAGGRAAGRDAWLERGAAGLCRQPRRLDVDPRSARGGAAARRQRRRLGELHRALRPLAAAPAVEGGS